MSPIAAAGTEFMETFNVICSSVREHRPGSSWFEVAGAGDRVSPAGGARDCGLRPVCGPGGCVGGGAGCGFGDCVGAVGVRGYVGFGGVDRFSGIGFAVGVGDLA